MLGDGRLLLGSQQVDAPELTRRIEFESAHQAHADRALEVRIRADRQVPYRHVEPILLACARCGVWKVTFAVIRPEG